MQEHLENLLKYLIGVIDMDMDSKKINITAKKVKQLLDKGLCDVEICRKMKLDWEEFWDIFYYIYKYEK